MAANSGPVSPQHAPALGLTHRLLGRFHVTGVFWYRFPYWAFTHLPSWLDWLIVPPFATFFFLTLGRIRGALAANLDPVLGPATGWERGRRSFLTIRIFAWCLAERYRRLADPQRFRLVADGEEHWRSVMESPGGAIIATAHIGPWETAAQFGGAESHRRIHVVREKEIDPRAQEFIREILARTGGDYVTHFSGDDLTLSFDLAAALRQGEVVALQSDRPRAGGRTVMASLFGQPMPLPVGPAALARVTGVPIVPVFNFREGRFLMRTVVRPPFVVANTADRSADIAAAVHHLAAEIEWAIRQHPHQWFCFRKLWP
jgi:lauroyl/myristoyl acyltransferase